MHTIALDSVEIIADIEGRFGIVVSDAGSTPCRPKSEIGWEPTF
jgi:hypothetical protein